MSTLPISSTEVTSTPALQPAQRVAVILALLEPPQAREIADHIDSESLPHIISAYEQMRSVKKPILLETIANFVAEMRSKAPRVYGGPKRAAELADTIMEQDVMPIGIDLSDISGGEAVEELDTSAIWSQLAEMKPGDLARLMSRERPSVIAAILARVPEDIGGAVMGALPEEIAIAVTAQMAKSGPLSALAMEAITETLRIRTQEQEDGVVDDGEFDPVPRLSAILNRCAVSRQRAVLEDLRAENPEQADAVEKRLVRFETLVELLPRNAAPMIFREVDDSTLNTALRYGVQNAPESTEYLYANISQRLAEQIRERVEATPMPSDEDGEKAQTEIVSRILWWTGEGRFTLNGLPQ